MKFNGATAIDNVNSDRYAFERHKLLVFNFYLKHLPHIFSHIYCEIMFNKLGPTNNQIDPLRYIYVNFLSTKKFCEQIHCQLSFPRGQNCKPDTEPFVFKSGNSDISACHSACYNLYDTSAAENQTIATDKYRGPFTMWSNRMQCCQAHTNSVFALGFDDYTRSDIHPNPRIDTIGTGFDLDTELFVDGEKNETFRFLLNKYYCDDFKLEFDADHCKESPGQFIFGLLLSETLYKACQYGVRYASTGVKANEVNKPQLPPVTKEAPINYATWLSTINSDATFFNPNLSLADLGITKSTLHLIFTTEYGWPGRLVEPLIITREPTTNPDIIVRDYAKINEYRPLHLQVDPNTGRRLNDSFDLLDIYRYINEDALIHAAANNIKPEEVKRNVFEFLYSVLAGLVSVDGLESIGAGLLLDQLRKVAGGIKQIAETLEREEVTLTMVKLAKRALVHDLAPAFVKGTLELITKSLRIMSTTLKIGSVIFDIIGFLDFFVQFADFFNQQKLGDQGSIDSYSHFDLETNFQLYGYRTVEMSPVHVISVMEHLNMPKVLKEKFKDEQLTALKCTSKDYVRQPFEIPFESVGDRNDYALKILWTTEFIYALKFNSNGLRIDWSLDTQLMPVSDIEKVLTSVNIESFLQYKNFSKNFLYKYKYLQVLLPCVFLVLIFAVFGLVWLSMFALLLLSVGISLLVFK